MQPVVIGVALAVSRGCCCSYPCRVLSGSIVSVTHCCLCRCYSHNRRHYVTVPILSPSAYPPTHTNTCCCRALKRRQPVYPRLYLLSPKRSPKISSSLRFACFFLCCQPPPPSPGWHRAQRSERVQALGDKPAPISLRAEGLRAPAADLTTPATEGLPILFPSSPFLSSRPESAEF